MIPTIFVSAPSILLAPQERILNNWLTKIYTLGFGMKRLKRRDYQSDVWGQLQRLITTSDGVLAFGFRQLSIQVGVWRPGTLQESSGPATWTSPWIQVEASLGIGAGLPVLAIADHGVAEGLFNSSTWAPPLYGVTRDMPQCVPAAWVRDVHRLHQGAAFRTR